MHIPHPFQQQNQRGDTVIEVLIALAIISSVLAGAFFVTNHSSQNVRDTEEHSQAIQLLQGQVEQIRAAATDGASDADIPTYFCYDTSGSLQIATSATDFSQCPNDFGGTSGAVYQFLIEKSDPPSGTSKLFTASVRWDGVRGQTNSEQLLYKIALAP
jgi:prepilin-type N-terminal cleavage/methylation domain-containing protein